MKIKKNQGFSLLEILVAFTIMALSLGIMLNIFSSGVNTAIIAEDYIIATQLAESLMASTGVEQALEAGERSGIEADKYQWRVMVTESSDMEVAEQSQLKLMNISVQVHWDDGQQQGRSLELNSIKAGIK